MGVEKCHEAGPHSCPYQQPHVIGLQFTGQGLVQSQDLEEQQWPTHDSQDLPPHDLKPLPGGSGVSGDRW